MSILAILPFARFLVSRLALAVLFVPVVAGAAELIPHEAVYGFSLGVKRGGSGLIGADGEMSIRLEKACDGWLLSQRVNLRTHGADGRTAMQETRFAGFETFDGTRFRFAGSHREDGTGEEFKGTAQVGRGGGRATLSKPEAKEMFLPAGTLFPVAHTRLLIERAEAGEQNVTRTVFDGADEDGLKEAAAFIGPRIAAGTPGSKDPLLARSGWVIRMAMFPPEGDAAAPEFEIEMLQLDNGVAPRIRLDYGAFAVDARLRTLVALAAPQC